jgi:hypothetical protein
MSCGPRLIKLLARGQHAIEFRAVLLEAQCRSAVRLPEAAADQEQQEKIGSPGRHAPA